MLQFFVFLKWFLLELDSNFATLDVKDEREFERESKSVLCSSKTFWWFRALNKFIPLPTRAPADKANDNCFKNNLDYQKIISNYLSFLNLNNISIKIYDAIENVTDWILANPATASNANLSINWTDESNLWISSTSRKCRIFSGFKASKTESSNFRFLCIILFLKVSNPRKALDMNSIEFWSDEIFGYGCPP